MHLQRGRREALDELIRRYEHELYGYLRRYTGDDELAQDVFQNTFLHVYLKIDQYESGRAARPWLYAIATHQAVDALRRRQRQRDRTTPLLTDGEQRDESSILWEPAARESDDPLDSLARSEQQALVRSAVAGLPEFLRQVVLLVYFQGLKYHEAAEVLGIPVGTIKSRLHNALKRLMDVCSDKESAERLQQNDHTCHVVLPALARR